MRESPRRRLEAGARARCGDDRGASRTRPEARSPPRRAALLVLAAAASMIHVGACELSTTGNSAGYVGESAGDTQSTGPDGEEPLVCQESAALCMDLERYKFDLVWAPTAEALIKIDANTRSEVSRYKTSDVSTGVGAPVRVAVSLIGEAAVANAHDPWVSVFAAIPTRCADIDGGGISTAGPGAALPWGEDECRRWARPLPSTIMDTPVLAWDGLRPTQVNCTLRTPNLWIALRVGGMTPRTEIYRILPEPDRSSSVVLSPETIIQDEASVVLGAEYDDTPYDGATDSHNNLWLLGSGSSDLARIDAMTLELTTHGRPTEGITSMHALTIGPGDRLWMSSEDTLHSYDPLAARWESYNIGQDDLTYGDGLHADRDGNVWIYAYSYLDDGLCRLLRWNTATKLMTSRPLDACLSGDWRSPGSVSLDGLGGIWLLNEDGALYAAPEGSSAEALDLAPSASSTNYDATGMALRAAHPC